MAAQARKDCWNRAEKRKPYKGRNKTGKLQSPYRIEEGEKNGNKGTLKAQTNTNIRNEPVRIIPILGLG